jgi:putative flippase GtrA
MSITSKKIIGHSSLRYGLIGIVAFGADYVTLLGLYQSLHISLFWAASTGFIIGFIISFLSNRQWVFGGTHNKKVTRQITEYLLLALFNYFFTVQAVAVLNNMGIKPYIGKLLVMGLIAVWNYAIFRWVIFTRSEESHEIV